jgi:Zn-finger nucleic acid-binding protein
MRCPVCKDEKLQRMEITNNLASFSCTICEGDWIRYEDYERWNKSTDERTNPISQVEDYAPIFDSKQANLCPDCGRILIKYKIDKDLNFSVDHCGTCNGVWLDKNEWENLITHNLHHLMYSFFTKPWQNELRDEISKERFEKQYNTRFGHEDYEKLKAFREWLYSNRSKDSMLAYLIDRNPYKI